jgi:hypothetical protein
MAHDRRPPAKDHLRALNRHVGASSILIARIRIGDAEDSPAIDEPDAGGKFGLLHPLAQRN